MQMSKTNYHGILLRRGWVDNDRDGTPLLINENREAYRVNDTAVSIWNMCNGITFEDLFLEVLRISSGRSDEVRNSLEEMIFQFRHISVVELKYTASVSEARKSGMQT